MAATIQQILKPTRARGLDTSGNNNHAQIYSGRALEFDGVTDYLNVSGSSSHLTFVDYTEETTAANRAWTVAVWFNYDAVSSANQHLTGYDDSQDTAVSNYLRISANEKLGFYDLGGGAGREANTILKPKTWYRAVFVYNGSDTVNFYLNGVADGSGTLTAGSNNNADLNIGLIGGKLASSVFGGAFAGKMSDFQVWQGAWTAADVEYDYLNPEQLVLNRGGTSLTNSNLKLWYPMNDGHRGNQSYVLDASNTGVGDEIEMDGDFSEFTTISSPRGNSNISGIALTNWIEQGDNDGEYADSTGSGAYTISKIENGIRLETTEAASASWHHRIYNTIGNSLTEGVTYRLKFDLKADAQRAVSFQNTASTVRLTSTPASPSSTEFTTYTKYFTMTGDSNLGFFIFGNGTNVGSFFEIRNVSLVPINNKNNATTVFLGDEMITNDRNQLFDEAGQWSGYNGPATAEIDGGKFKVVTDGDGTTQGAQLLVANLTTPVVGRTYRITAKLDDTGASANTGANYKFMFGGVDALIKASDGSPSDGTINTTEQEYYADVVANDAAGDLIIKITSSTNDAATTFTIDDVSVKEIGVASGWTDADQQLDIPQTALQSYNQLAFSDDYRSGIALSDGGTTTHQITTNSHTWSFWMFRNQEDSDTFHYVLQKGEFKESGYYIFLTGGKLVFVTNTSGANQSHSTDATVPKGKWFHAAITVHSSGTASQWYINGQAESSVTGITAPVANTDYTSFYAYDSNNTTPPTTHPGYQCLTELSSWNKQLSEDEIVEIYNDGLALDCTTHSASANLVGYWRNNGLAEWEDLSTNNYHGTPTSITETMLITAGVDSSRDSQGFLMNRQRTTNSANIAVLTKQDGTNDEGSYIYLPDNPLYTGSAVTNYTISFWVKFAVNPTDLDHNMHFIDTNQSNANRTFKIHITSGGVLYLYTYYGSSAGNESIYCDYGFPGKLGNAIQTPPVNNNAGIGEAFDVNNWYHLTWTFDHDRTTGSGNADNTNSEDTNFTPYKMYVNGICVAVEGREGANSAMTTARSMQAADTPVMIGTAIGSSTIPETGSQKDFKGQIDDICFYSDTLTDEEVLRNYNAGKRSHK